jgi:hypothetical protein
LYFATVQRRQMVAVRLLGDFRGIVHGRTLARINVASRGARQVFDARDVRYVIDVTHVAARKRAL